MHLKNEKGSALSLVLVIMLVLGILGTVLLFLNTTEGRKIIREEKRVQAYYIAKSGAEAMAEYIINYPEEIENLDTEVNSDNVSLGKGKFTVNVVKSDGKVIIRSIGKVDSVKSEVSLTLRETSGGYYTKLLWE